MKGFASDVLEQIDVGATMPLWGPYGHKSKVLSYADDLVILYHVKYKNLVRARMHYYY